MLLNQINWHFLYKGRSCFLVFLPSLVVTNELQILKLSKCLAALSQKGKAYLNFLSFFPFKGNRFPSRCGWKSRQNYYYAAFKSQCNRSLHRSKWNSKVRIYCSLKNSLLYSNRCYSVCHMIACSGNAVRAWSSDWASGEKAGPAQGSSGASNTMHLSDWKGQNQDPPLSIPHLRFGREDKGFSLEVPIYLRALQTSWR